MTGHADDPGQLSWPQKTGESWVRRQDQTDRQLAPLGKLALDALAPRSGEWALDVGCGAGATLLELCRRVGPSGGVCGVDVSEPLLKRARERVAEAGLGNVEFLLGDAQQQPFRRKYDLLFSRFGVMFFADSGAAFVNLRAALVHDARVGFVCWQAMHKNAWASVLLDAVLPLTSSGKPPPLLTPDLPGPFYFGTEERLRSVLGSAGYRAIEITPVEQEIQIGGAQTLDEAVDYCTEIGPAARVMAEADPAEWPAFGAALRGALAPFTTARGTWMGGAVFVVSARA